MRDPIAHDWRGAAGVNTLDLAAFFTAFVLGVSLYFWLHFSLRLPQLLVTVAIISTMVGYAAVMAFVPRLRIRRDQAGDNAYYLGLLFTLLSMAVALYEFGTFLDAGPGIPADRSGARIIIANFGIALGSTIAGIFLRVLLHQMRVDPADVEGMTRIELAEAAKQVRGRLQNVTIDIGRFHAEIQQRANDLLEGLVRDSLKSAAALREELGRSTSDMISSTVSAHARALEETRAATEAVNAIASAAASAVERLGAVEPPPLTLSRRLTKLATVLEKAGDEAERTTSSFHTTAKASVEAIGEISRAAEMLRSAAESMSGHIQSSVDRMEQSARAVSAALADMGQGLGRDQTLLSELVCQTKRAADESEVAQKAATLVLVRLTELTGGLVDVLSQHRNQG